MTIFVKQIILAFLKVHNHIEQVGCFLPLQASSARPSDGGTSIVISFFLSY